jgi:hypothetical protein
VCVHLDVLLAPDLVGHDLRGFFKRHSVSVAAIIS